MEMWRNEVAAGATEGCDEASGKNRMAGAETPAPTAESVFISLPPSDTYYPGERRPELNPDTAEYRAVVVLQRGGGDMPRLVAPPLLKCCRRRRINMEVCCHCRSRVQQTGPRAATERSGLPPLS
ncbi:unnamed protein product [Boreogadus saida]